MPVLDDLRARYPGVGDEILLAALDMEEQEKSLPKRPNIANESAMRSYMSDNPEEPKLEEDRPLDMQSVFAAMRGEKSGGVSESSGPDGIDMGAVFSAMRPKADQKDPGYMGDIGRGIMAGAEVQLPKMAGQALKFFGADETGDALIRGAEARNTADIQESAAGQAQTSPLNVRGNVYEAATNAVPSMAPGAAGAAVGAGIGMLAGPGGAAVGALAGYAIGSIASLPMFYGSQAQESYEAVKKEQLSRGASEQQAEDIARQTAHAEGAIEAGGELVADVIPFAKLFKPFAKPVGSAVVKSALMPTMGQFAKNVAMIEAGEVGTEMAQQAGEDWARQSIGGTGPGATWDETSRVIMPTAIMSFIPGMAGAGAKYHQQQAALTALSNPETDPDLRGKIALGAAAAMEGVNPDVSRAFAGYAADQIKAGKPIEIGDDSIYLTHSVTSAETVDDAIKAMDKLAPSATELGDLAISEADDIESRRASIMQGQQLAREGTARTEANSGFVQPGMVAAEPTFPTAVPINQERVAGIEAERDRLRGIMGGMQERAQANETIDSQTAAQRQSEIEAAYQRHFEEANAAKEEQIAAVRRQALEQQATQAETISKVNEPTQEPTAMQLAFQRAQQLKEQKNGLQEKAAQAQEVANGTQIPDAAVALASPPGPSIDIPGSRPDAQVQPAIGTDGVRDNAVQPVPGSGETAAVRDVVRPETVAFEPRPDGSVAVRGFSQAQIKTAAKDIGAKVLVGTNGNAVFSKGTDLAKLKTALGTKETKPKRKLTGNLRNDLNILAPGLYTEVSKGGDGENNSRDMSLVAEYLQDQGYVLPEGKPSDAVVEMIRQDVANGGGTVNAERQVAAMSRQEELRVREEALRLANEYGVETKAGIKRRPYEEVEAEVEQAIEHEVGVAGRALASTINRAKPAGMSKEEIEGIAREVVKDYIGDTRQDAKILMYRETTGKIEDRINAIEDRSREGDEQSTDTGADQRAQGDEARPELNLQGQTESEAREQVEPEISKEQIDREATAPFSLQQESQPSRDAVTGGQGDLLTPDGRPSVQAADRRHDTANRKRIEHMSVDEMRRELLTDALTGIGNRRAYEEADKLPVQVSIDADSLKWINDNLGHQAGDESLKMIAQAIRDETNQAFHLSGDEFVIQTDTVDGAERIMAAVQKRLDGSMLEAELPSGEKVTLTLGISYGTGQDLKSAERGLQEHKQAREVAGLRAARGETPPSATRSPRGQGQEAPVSRGEEEVTPDGFKAVSGNEWVRKTQDGNTITQVNIRHAGDPLVFIVRRSVRFTDGITGAPSEELGRFNTMGEAVEEANRALKVQETPEPAAAEESARQDSAAAEPIKDFGEKIGGARKDVWSGFKDKIAEVSDDEIANQPFSKVWPEPDYQAMLDAGADPWTVGFMHAARDEVPSKPRVGYKVRSWAEKVKILRDMTSKLLSGEYSADVVQQKLKNLSVMDRVSGGSGLKKLASRVELYELVGHAKSLEGISFDHHHYSLYRGRENVSLWVVEKEAKASAWSNWPSEIATGDTKEDALAAFKARYAELNTEKAKAKEASFDIYAHGRAYYVGKKVGRNIMELAGPFNTVKEARDYRTEHQTELAEKLDKRKEIPQERRDTNNPRVGEDMRNGQDVTPEMFSDSFGFRGVEFGNWVEQKKRQTDLNEAFDALMDMAAILEVPPKAISLNGQLGLAFGARGTGGIHAAKAHYEPGRIVVNLTKKEGAGSLGHEWFHSLDNYFSRLRARGSDMMTDALDVSLAARDSEFVANTAVRKEMISAFGEVVKAIKNTALKARSSKLDAKRSKEYWTTTPEMSARAFESYLISKLQDQNASNDYLANIVDEDTWKAAEKLGFELDESYPYPTAGEVPVIRAAFDHFFQTVQTRETDKGIALESRGTPSTGETPSAIRSSLNKTFGKSIVASLEQKGLLKIVPDVDSLPAHLNPSSQAIALFDPATDTAYLIADRMNAATAARELLHETGTHYGLARMLGDKGYNTLKKRVELMEKSGNKRVREAYDFVRKNYMRRDSAGELVRDSNGKLVPVYREGTDGFFQETLANIGQDADIQAKPWWKELIAAVKRFLVKMGYGNMIGTSDIQDMVLHSLKAAAQEEIGGQSEGGLVFASEVSRGGTAQTETEAFKKWFGDSKVVDAEGKPLRVYHGTARGDVEFGGRERGTYFTSSTKQADGYTHGTFFRGGEEPAIYPAYLALRNPMVIDALGKRNDNIPFPGQQWAPKVFGNLPKNAVTVEEAFRRAVSAGHDGLIVRNVVDTAAVDGKDKGDVYVAQHPEQIKSAVGNRGTFDPNSPSILESRAEVAGNSWSIPEVTGGGLLKLLGTDKDSLLYALQDKHIDTRRAVEAIRKASGDIEDKWNPYLQEELFHGRAAKGVKDFLDLELKPLLVEMKARGVELSDFEEYLWNRHAEERNVQIAKINPNMPDGGSGLKTADARKYMAGIPESKRKGYEALARRIDAINAKTRQSLVAAGLEKSDTVKAWEGAYKHYVPLQREDVETAGIGTGKGYSVRGSSTKRAIGSGKPVADILGNITQQRERAVVRAEKNRVSNALLGLALEAPNDDFWTVDTAPTERVVETRGGKDQVVERIVPGFVTRDNVVSTRINGDDHYIIFNESDPRAVRMSAALKNIDADQMGRVLSIVSKGTRWFASINTQYNPVFGVINLLRDSQGALLNLSTTPIAGEQKKVLGYTIDALRGIYSDLRAHRKGQVPSSSWAQLWEEFQKEGGQTGYRDQYANAEARTESIEKELRRVGEGKAKGFGRAVFSWLSDYNETMENAVRLASYRAAKEKGISNQQAASIAKNLTVNFNRHGQATTQIGALYAFFNASAQGTARMVETLAGPMGKKIIAGGILLGSMQAMLFALAGFDDDEPPEFVRERALILPLPNGKYLSIPMPLGFHVLPNLGRIPTEFVLGGFRDPGKRVIDLLGLFMDTFNPIGNAGVSLQTIAPTVIDPLAALAENRDWTGKPIAKENTNPLSPKPGHLMAKDTASAFSKATSYWINVATGGTKYKPGMASPTPDQIDYLIGQAMGGVGREYLKAEQTVTSAATGEDMPLYKIPLLGRFIGDTTGQSAEGGRFYENIKRINEHEAELTGLRKEGDSRAVLEYMRENPESRFVKMANSIERQVSELRGKKRAALERGNPDMVKVIDKAITARMKTLNDAIKQLEERQKQAA